MKSQKGKDGIYNKYIKRLLDVVISFTALVVLSPVLLILTVVGAIAMKGNPFFVQKRPGKIDPKTGKETTVNLFKFRTMTARKIRRQENYCRTSSDLPDTVRS